MSDLNGNFSRAVLISLLAHAVLLSGMLALPGGGSRSMPVEVYTVRIAEVPAQPHAPELSPSTSAVSALRLDAPTLNLDTAPTAPETPTGADLPPAWEAAGLLPPSAEIPPPALAPAHSAARAPTPAPTPGLPPAPALNAPLAPAGDTRLLQPLLGAPQSTVPTELPQLPGVPTDAPRPLAREQSAGATGQAKPTAPLPPSLEPAATPADTATGSADSSMERLRRKVAALNLKIDTAPAPAQSQTQRTAVEQSVQALRIYQNNLRESVKEIYSYPASFPQNLTTRVRVVINRQGDPLKVTILESSGDERFDRLVCENRVFNARFPAIPEGVVGDTLTFTFTCTP